jgi:hypothetical protein
MDARLDADADIDQDDFAIFNGCLSAPNTPPGENCAP